MALKTVIVKKLSAKVLVGNVKAYMKDVQEGQSVELFRVVGIARKLKSGTSNYGDWTSLIGEFIAEPLVGAKKEQRFRTGQLFLPDVAQTMIEGALEDTSVNGVQTAFVIAAIADENSNTGYVYTCDFLVEPEENDPLEMLVAKALPAPATATKTDTAKEKATA